MIKESLVVGTRIYCTGDLANEDDWATVRAVSEDGRSYRLTFDKGGETWILSMAIGDVYRGHCNPRFVTEAAYRAFRKLRLEALGS